MSSKNRWIKQIRYINLALSFGITMTLTILLAIYGGLWLDRRLGSTPLFLILGILLGVGAAFYSLLREILKLNEQNKKRKLEENKQNEGFADNSQNEAGKKDL